MTQDEIIDMARHTANTFGTRMCDENGHTHGEELYVMGIDEIVEAIKFVAVKEREACAKVVDDIEAQCIAKDADDPPLKHVAAAIRARGGA
jgi:lipid A disaccharide synthetase